MRFSTVCMETGAVDNRPIVFIRGGQVNGAMGLSMRMPPLLLVLVVLATALGPIAAASDDPPQVLPGRPVKDKVLYLQTSDIAKNVGGISTRNFLATTPGTLGQSLQSNHRFIAEWYLYPELAGVVALNGMASLVIWYHSTDCCPGGTPSWDVFFDRVAADGTLTGIASVLAGSVTPDTLAYEEKTITFAVSTVASPLQPGESLRLRINVGGNSANDYFIAWGDATYDSRLVLPTEDYLRVVPQVEGGIYTTDSLDQPRVNFDPTSANKDMTFYATVTDPFGGYDVRQVNLTVRDPSNAIIPGLDAVAMTRFSGFFNSFALVFRTAWNYSGQPNGLYSIQVDAVDQTGYQEFTATGSYGVHLETDVAATFSIGLPPLSVWVRVWNEANATVSGATVEARLGPGVADSVVTDTSGLGELRLFGGTYVLAVVWTAVDVFTDAFVITASNNASTPMELRALIVSPTFYIVDGRGIALEQAAVYIRHPNGTADLDARVTDANGQVALTLVAGGDYRVSVQWRGKTVADTGVAVNRSTVYTVRAAVYYIDFQARDQTGLPVPDAFIEVIDPVYSLLIDTQITDAGGDAVSRVPGGDFSVSVSYFGSSVFGPTALAVTDDTLMVLTLQVYDVSLTIVDAANVTLEGASVTVTSPALTKAANTGVSGRVSFKLSAGTYEVIVVWRTVEVFREERTVSATASSFRIISAVYHLTVTTVDRDDKAIVGAFVTAASGNETWAADFTDSAGTVDFRLPQGTYELSARYIATIGFTDVDTEESATASLNASRSMTIEFSRLPLGAFEQVATGVILLIIILFLILLYILWKLYRKSKGEDEKPTEKPGEETPRETPLEGDSGPKAPETVEKPLEEQTLEETP